MTIIGWGKKAVKNNQPDDRWWYVIPHFGTDFGEKASDLFPGENEQFRTDVLGYSDPDRKTGIMRIARRVDFFGIESNCLVFAFIKKNHIFIINLERANSNNFEILLILGTK